MNMLEVKHITVSHGKIRALHDVSLTVHAGEVVSLIGANGSGKSTFLKTLSGLMKPESGEIFFNDTRIDSLPGHEITRQGLVHVPEGRRIFPLLTVQENLDMGAFFRKDSFNVHSDMEMVFQLFPILQERTKQLGGTLSGGEQQMLAIGRALMSRPKLLMLDEPSMGLAPMVVEKIFGVIRDINKMGVTILLVEQNARAALRIATRGYVLETGSVIFDDAAANLLQNEKVKQCYLGIEA